MPWETGASWPLSAFLSLWDVCCAPGESPWHSSPQTRPRQAHPRLPTSRQIMANPARPKPNLRHRRSQRRRNPRSQSPSGRNPSSRSRCVGIRRIRVPGRFRTTSDPHTSGQSATAQRTHRTRITGRPLPGRNRRDRRPGSRWTGDLRLSLPTSGPASRMLRTREGPPNRRVGRHPSSTGPRTSRRCRRSKAGSSARISQSDRMPSVPIRSRSTGVPYRIRDHSVQRRSRNHPGPREARTPAGRKARDPRASTASRRALREGESKTRVTREETVR